MLLAHHRSPRRRCFRGLEVVPKCVEYIVGRIYSRTVTFDPANDGKGSVNDFNVVRFLDIWCFMNWHESLFSLVYKNDLFAFPGSVNLKCKNCFPIPQGDKGVFGG